MTEDQLQAQCILIARNFYDCLVFSIPNGAYTGAKEAIKLKATGLTAGIPDLQVIYTPANKLTNAATGDVGNNIGGINAVFIELKVGKNNLSQQQILIHSKLAKYNFPVYTIRTLDEFKALLDTLQIPSKSIFITDAPTTTSTSEIEPTSDADF
jgi:hypothetical protein